MASQRGQRETAQLRVNAEEQITRLMTQLSDLEELREARSRCCAVRTPAARKLPACTLSVLVCAQDMEADEYESTKSETLKQLEEFHASLSRLMVRHAAARAPLHVSYAWHSCGFARRVLRPPCRATPRCADVARTRRAT
jgi:hypothetical protein